MTSWRDTAFAQAQDDIDALLTTRLDFAEQTLVKRGELFPFGVSVTQDGRQAMMAADPGLGERPDSRAVLELLYASAQGRSRDFRAVAFVADVRQRRRRSAGGD